MNDSIDHLNVITADCENMENYIIAANKASLDKNKAVTWARVKKTTVCSAQKNEVFH